MIGATAHVWHAESLWFNPWELQIIVSWVRTLEIHRRVPGNLENETM